MTAPIWALHLYRMHLTRRVQIVHVLSGRRLFQRGQRFRFSFSRLPARKLFNAAEGSHCRPSNRCRRRARGVGVGHSYAPTCSPNSLPWTSNFVYSLGIYRSNELTNAPMKSSSTNTVVLHLCFDPSKLLSTRRLHILAVRRILPRHGKKEGATPALSCSACGCRPRLGNLG
jgi:hypothetical protein